ncbi:3'-5' exonuclease (plasmid) [Massilia varians]|jgi:DNA polymerase III subunit epsilon|uniref:3'-5' exonuclease n=1 Tax=Massilia TaxID=149698 RepID=UPI000A05B6E5|nr:exonuclease domain-containing protein [Massilia alkalitolerans]
MEPTTSAIEKRSDPMAGIGSVIDTETTGLDPKKDRVISFGHVRLVDGKITEKIEWFFNPGDVPINPEAMKVHGITPEFLADKPPIKGYLLRIVELMVESIVCGHNLKFDVDMLNAELARHRYPPLEQFIAGKFDTMQDSRKRWPGKAASLDALCERVGVSTAHREKHGALTDAVLCAEALIAMHREQRSFLDVFAEDTSPVALNDIAGDMPEILIVPASAQELATHASYLAGMNGDAPIWYSYSAPAPAAADCDDEESDDEVVSSMAPC